MPNLVSLTRPSLHILKTTGLLTDGEGVFLALELPKTSKQLSLKGFGVI